MMQKQTLIISHMQTNVQPVSEQWLPLRPASPINFVLLSLMLCGMECLFGHFGSVIQVISILKLLSPHPAAWE